jgi:phytoene dehydrogenase-like protein
VITTGHSNDRLVFLLETVEKEGRHLLGTTARLFVEPIDPAWVRHLEDRPELAERTDAFATRFGRMQDTLGDKLIPELLRRLAETPGAAIDNLNRMEKLGLLRSTSDWLEARNLRNRMIHEYMRDEAEFAGALNRAAELIPLLVDTYNAVHGYIRARFPAPPQGWPAELPTIRPAQGSPLP